MTTAKESPDVKAARLALAEHEGQCPGDHLACYGNPKLEKARAAWILKKERLQTALDLAKEKQHSGWRDASGNKVEVIISRHKEPFARDPKGGRPRSEKPSAVAQKWRDIRAKRKGEQP